MKINQVLLAGLLGLLSTSAYAVSWGDVIYSNGNGGDVLDCGGTVELFDFYEGRSLRGLDVELGGGSWQERVRYALSRLDRFAPDRANQYRTWLSEFESESHFIRGVELVDAPDWSYGGYYPNIQENKIPPGCLVRQAAVHREPEFSGEKRYTVNQDIWDRLDESNRAGLVLDLFLFREQPVLWGGVSYKNAIPTRVFNSLLVSSRLANMSWADYFDYNDDNAAHWLDSTRYQGIAIRGADKMYSPNAIAHAGADWQRKSVIFGQEVQLADGVYFYPDGKIQYISVPDHGVVIPIHGENKTFKKSGISNSGIGFYPDGSVSFGPLQPAQFRSDLYDLDCSGFTTFYPNGDIEFCHEPGYGKALVRGQWVTFYSADVRFDAKGNLIATSRISESGVFVSVQGQNIQVRDEALFWPDGTPRAVLPTGEARFLIGKRNYSLSKYIELDVEGRIRAAFSKDTYLEFSESGEVTQEIREATPWVVVAGSMEGGGGASYGYREKTHAAQIRLVQELSRKPDACKGGWDMWDKKSLNVNGPCYGFFFSVWVKD